MTTKSEQSEAAAEPPIAVEGSHAVAGAEEQPDPVQPFQPLPSIIVDPAALTGSVPPAAAEPPSVEPLRDEGVDQEASAPAANRTLLEGAPAPDAPSAQQAISDPAGTDARDSAESESAPSPAEPDVPHAATRGNGGSGADLSDFEAERFATDYRASWEPGEALDAPMPQVVHPVASLVAGAASAAGPSSSAPAPIAEPLVLPGAARRRGLALTAVAVVAFVALLALALSSARTPAPPPEASVEASPPEAAPSEPVAPAPIEVAPPPAAVPVEQPAIGLAAAGSAAEPAVAAAAGAAAAAAAGAVAVAPIAPAVAVAEPTAIVPAAVPAPATEPAPAPPPVETVRIRIATVPEDATITIDGAPVPNPYDELVPKSEKHRVVASAPGRETSDQLVGFERRRDLVLRLKPVKAPRPQPEREAAPVAKPAPRPARPATLKITKKPAAEAPRKGAAFVSESPY